MKIVWAYDPFKENNDLNFLGKKILETLFNNKSDLVCATYIASKAESELNTAFNIDEDTRYTLYPESIIQKQLKAIKAHWIKALVIPSAKISLSSLIKEFVTFNHSNKTDLVVMATNSKKTLPRLIFGSFCESFVHSSECDMLIYHQKTKFSLKPHKKILYAHDFTEKGNAGLQRVIHYAKKWDAQLIVVHVPMFLSNMTYEKFKKITEKKALIIEELIKKSKSSFEMHVSYEAKPITNIILKKAKKENVDFIAMTAKSSKLTALLGGSVTRQILRESKIPSLIIKIK